MYIYWDNHSIAKCNSTNRHKYYGVECQPPFVCKIQEWLTGFREHNFMPFWGFIWKKFWMSFSLHKPILWVHHVPNSSIQTLFHYQVCPAFVKWNMKNKVLKPKIVARRVSSSGLLRVSAEWEVVEMQLWKDQIYPLSGPPHILLH